MSIIKDIENLPIALNKLQNSSILLTGANGMIMSSLADALVSLNDERNYGIQIYLLCRNRKNAENRFRDYLNRKDISIIIQDAAEPLQEEMEFDFIVHGASGANPKAFNETPVDVMKANFIGVMNYLEMCRKHLSTRLLYISSSEIYGENWEGVEIINEDMHGDIDCTKFRSCYPESKRAAETLCASYKHQYGADVVMVRPAFIFGKNIISSNNRADVYFLRQALNHEDIHMYSKGAQIRSYCYINDTITALLTVLLNGESGEVYNIGNQSRVISLHDYAQLLADAGGVKLLYEPETKPENITLLQTQRIVLGTAKLEKLGWRNQYSVEDGIRDIFMQANT